MSVQTVAIADGVELWAEMHRGGDGRVALLLGGAGQQATAWEPGFIQPFTTSGLDVIRFDWRDVGQSTWRSFRDHPYTAQTMVEDALEVLDAFEVGAAHFVGFSMGGIMAQLAALAHPDRVQSLALVSSGFASARGNEFWTGERSAALFALQGQRKPTNRDEEIARLLETWRHMSGTGQPFDESAWTARIVSWVDRGQNWSCPHLQLWADVGSEDREAALGGVTAPALVVHGDDDAMFPLPHGEAVAAALPNSELMVLPGRGHEILFDGEIADHVATFVSASS